MIAGGEGGAKEKRKRESERKTKITGLFYVLFTFSIFRGILLHCNQTLHVSYAFLYKCPAPCLKEDNTFYYCSLFRRKKTVVTIVLLMILRAKKMCNF